VASSDLNRSHDPARRSWVESANAGGDFPLQNLPFGVFRREGEAPRGGVAIGEQILDLPTVLAAGLLHGEAVAAARAAAGPVLNPLLALSPAARSALRLALGDLLDADAPRGRAAAARAADLLVPMAEAALLPPVAIGGFTDFLASIHHTRRMGTGRLPPAFLHQPLAYAGRASSIGVSGATVCRPCGQWRDEAGVLHFGPEPWLDFELEVGAFVAGGNALGTPIPIAAAAEHLFGCCLLNDWSARAMQRFETIPLGPFTGKSFATTISPWIVTVEALAPFRVPAAPRGPEEAPVPPHLAAPADQAAGAFAIALEALLLTPRLRAAGAEPAPITRTAFAGMYWTLAQMLAQHASNGCNLLPGDLFASGTTSGAEDTSCACLAERTRYGAAPLALPDGEQRAWLEDGDEVILRGRATAPGRVPIGFGECRARVVPALV